MIRLCAFDLDGTLLNSESVMTEASAAALRALYDHGCSIALVTGRPPCFAQAYLLQAGIRGYVAASNGSWISSPSGELIYLREFPPSLAAELTVWLDRRGSRFAVQFADGITGNQPYDASIADRFVRYREMSSQFGLLPELPRTDASFPGQSVSGVLKVAVTADPAGIAACLDEIHLHFPSLDTSLSGRSVGDINLKGDSKGTAVRRIALHLGADRDSICCFGDYDNDIPMFREAGMSVAMNNASEKVRESAVHITFDNDSEGIAEAVRTLLIPSFDTAGGNNL